MPPANRVDDRDRGWRDLLRRAQALQGKAWVKVGILADSDRGGLHQQGPDGKSSPLTVAEIAVVNEFGTEDGKIPARSFLRSSFDESQDELTALSAKLIAAVVLDGKMDAIRALNLLGMKFASIVRNKVVGGDQVPPPNAPSTTRRKEAKGKWNKRGKAQAAGAGVRTLVDTGRMVGAIAWAVVIGDDQRAESYIGR